MAPLPHRADDIVPSGPNNKRSHSEMVQDSGNGSSGLDSSSAVTAPIIVQQQRDTDADAAVQAPPTSRARLSSGGPQSHLNQYDPHKGTDGIRKLLFPGICVYISSNELNLSI